MTTEELKKEAERLLQDYGLHWDKKSVTARLANTLRAVHEVGFNEAKEKAANLGRYLETGEPQANAFYYRGRKDGVRAYSKRIRALKSGE